MTIEKSPPVYGLRGRIIVPIIFASLRIQSCDTFQAIKQWRVPITKASLQEDDDAVSMGPDADDSDRRAFLKSSSVIFLSLITISPQDFAMAELDDDDVPYEPTTPSISEGDLILSQPPPHRESVEVVVPAEETEGKKKKTADPRFFIAGGASAAISHGVTTPIDVVKTRMQSDSTLADMSPPEVALKIVEEDGPQALSVGLGPTVIGYGVEGALKFGVYESLKPVLLSLWSGGGSSEAYLVAAVCAGALASITLVPMEETRIRLVTDPTFGDGLVDGLPKLIKEEGLAALFQKGMPPMLAKQVPYTVGKQVSFDMFAGMLYTVLVGLTWETQKEIALEVEIGAAFLASVVACLVSHPGDVLLTATYNNSDGSDGDGFGSTIKKVWDEGGISALFGGLNARFLHVGCIITFQLVLYDQLKQFLGLPASGA